MRAVMEKAKHPVNSDWNFFRQSIRPKAAQAYEEATTNKWQSFYNVAYAESALTDRIIGINARGLRVAN